jgi:hypothetical protein
MYSVYIIKKVWATRDEGSPAAPARALRERNHPSKFCGSLFQISGEALPLYHAIYMPSPFIKNFFNKYQ